jgi:ATP-dependent exoDNAse (exonuclease V) beta subunit
MAVRFDEDQLGAARVERNAVVMAGAGSGKTSVLAERFVWLLRERGARVEEVLALTFTQKAAAEMFERIHSRLSEEGEAALESLRSFDRAQISTLDSFCAEIARDAAGMFGLPPRFASDEEGAARLASELSLDFLLSHWREPALSELLRVWGFQVVWRELFAELAVGHFHLAGGESLEAACERQLSECRAAAGRLWAGSGAARAGLQSLEPRTKTIRDNREAALLLSRVGELLARESYAEAGQVLDGFRFKKAGARSAEDLRLMNLWVDELRDGLLPALREQCAALASRDTLRGAFAALERFRQQFLAAKRAAGLVTFRDVAEMAVAALLRDPALRQHYKRRFRFILIDEFQDNNRLQKQLLYLLAERQELCADRVPLPEELEPDKLFFVGDEKQSIYRFRGADVSVFASLAGELERAGGRGLRLDRNYRSSPGLVAFFNDLFQRVMAGALRDFEARYRGLASPRGAGPFAPEVRLLLQPRREADGEPGELASREEAEACAVARLIRERVDRKDLPVEDENGTVRPAGFADFAVLLRSTGNQVHFERMFRHFDVPYSTPNLRGLFLEAPASDLYQLLRLALHPADRSAYAGLLRSPLVNLSDEGFLVLMLSGERPFARLDGLGEEDRLRAERGRELVEFARTHADRLGHSELLHRLWYDEGYRWSLLRDPRTHNQLEFYDFLLALAARAEAQGDTLAAFLQELGENLGRYRRLDELEEREVLPSRPAAGVQLLTIHKSKGLEFPVVVLADTGNRGRARPEKRPYYASEAFGITLNLGEGNWFTRIGEEENEARELAEARRLLYVALTRARSQLILSGTLKRSQRGAHLDMLLAGLRLDAEDPFAGQPAPAGQAYDLRVQAIPELPLSALREGPPRRKPPELALLRGWYERQPARRPAVRREFSVREVSEELEQGLLPGFPAPAGPGRELPALPVDALLAELGLEAGFGTRTHDLLTRWLAQPSGPPPDADWRGVAPAHRAACQEAAVSLARRFLDSPLGRLAAAAAQREVEVPFVYRFEGGGAALSLSGQVDLVFETAEGLYLVDFKTDRRYREGQYAAQLGLYALAWAQGSKRPVLPVVFLLRSGEALPVTARRDWSAVFAALPR